MRVPRACMLELQRSVHSILVESWLKWIFKQGVRRQVTQAIHRIEKQVRKSNLSATRQIPERQAEVSKASSARVGQVRATEKLDFEADCLPPRWKRWKEEIALYMDLAMAGKPEDMKVKLSLCLIGTGDREFYERLPSASAPSDRTLAQVIKAFDGRCDPKKSETVDRCKFFTRFQPGRVLWKVHYRIANLGSDMWFWHSPWFPLAWPHIMLHLRLAFEGGTIEGT